MNRIELPANESALFQGIVRHRRFQPVRHQFRYSLFMWLLRLDELPVLFERFWQLGPNPWHWARFRREDYLDQPERQLQDVVIDKLASKLEVDRGEVAGEVWLLGQLRYLGCYFVKRDGIFRHVLAEVSNTPWNERHCYALDLRSLHPQSKEFHVSPFNPMGQEYHWRILPPEGNRLAVHLQVADQAGARIMNAGLHLRRVALERRSLNCMLMRKPSPTAALLAAIYWQALRLCFKRSPFYPHPGRSGDLGNQRS